MISVQENVTLAPFTTFHIGGVADYFVVVSSRDELIEAIEWSKNKSMSFFVLGTGANILVGDKGFRGLVIKNNANKFQISNVQYPISNNTSLRATEGSAAISQNKIASSPPKADPRNDNDYVLLVAESGATIADLIKFTLEKGLSGFEHYAGIPSSVGGALCQNLHFLSPDRSRTVFISEILENAVILSVNEGSQSKNRDSSRSVQNDNKITRTVDKDYFNFSYDYSSLHDTHDIVLSATFRLTPEDKDIIQQRIDANLKWRAEKHPENATVCSAGSVFRKIEQHGAGRLIEKVGLKGKKIGGAQISERHANFIINTGAASAKDVRELIFLAQEKVKNELDLNLQPEISFVGKF